MLGLYFSGTGNTKYCVEELVGQLDPDSIAAPIEAGNAKELISKHDTIVFGYPVYFSNLPKIARDFIIRNRNCFADKKIFIIATMGLFSGDGAGLSARLFKKCGAVVLGAAHIKMPDCIGDVRLLKKSLAENREIVKRADEKISLIAERLKAGKPTRNGLNIFCRLLGFLGQRLWFYNKTASYKNKPDVDTQKCIGCGRCADLCPTGNIEAVDGKAVARGMCTMCYRCVSYCPNGALTILGKNVYEQCKFENYQAAPRKDGNLPNMGEHDK